MNPRRFMAGAAVRRAHSSRFDDGFTLIEVLTAVVLLGIVTTAAIAFAIQGTESTAAQARRQVAIAIATNAMETVNAHVSSTDSATHVSYLLTGRQAAAMSTIWSAYSAYSGVADTYPGSDPTAVSATTPGPAIPVQSSTSQNGTDYTVTTLIGWCYKQSAAGDCKKIPTVTDPPATPPSGWSNRLMRVTAIVEWSTGQGCNAGTPCSYQTITLIDATDDLEWVSG